MNAEQLAHAAPMRRTSVRGFTLIEMVVVVMIVGILASAAMPLMALHKRRTQEAELRESLRTLRRAIDAYKQASDKGEIDIVKRTEDSGYPPSLDVLVKGVPKKGSGAAVATNTAVPSATAPTASTAPVQAASPANNAFAVTPLGAAGGRAPTVIYFLRRLPRDPFADPTVPAAQTWGLRSYASPPGAPAPGADVFDVYSLSDGAGLDGVPLREW
jgi:general secretion pathway protein G